MLGRHGLEHGTGGIGLHAIDTAAGSHAAFAAQWHMAELHPVDAAHQPSVVDERTADAGAEIDAQHQIAAGRAAARGFAAGLQGGIVIEQHGNAASRFERIRDAFPFEGREVG